MSTVLPLDQMTRAEKMRALDELWNDLYPNAEEADWPEWHLQALAETEARYRAGLEKGVPLDEAERLLRARLRR